MVREKIKMLKTQKGWSNKRLAEEANLPEDTVNKILSGTTRNPNTDTLRRLASALDVTLDELTAETSAAPVPPVLPVLPVPARSDPACAEIVRIYEQQLEKMEDRYERRLAEAHAREVAAAKKGDTRFYALLCVILVLFVVIIYLIVDALHGNWGFFQYQEALGHLIPYGTGLRDIIGSVIGGELV